jgi:hypothetical protein
MMSMVSKGGKLTGAIICLLTEKELEKVKNWQRKKL